MLTPKNREKNIYDEWVCVCCVCVCVDHCLSVDNVAGSCACFCVCQESGMVNQPFTDGITG